MRYDYLVEGSGLFGSYPCPGIGALKNLVWLQNRSH
jgi:hypothetical protein